MTTKPDYDGNHIKNQCSHCNASGQGSAEANENATAKALDLYVRVGLGQLERLTELLRDGILPMAGLDPTRPRQEASVEVIQRFDALMLEAKRLLGYPAPGSHGIHHPHVHQTVKTVRAVQRQQEQTQ